MAQYLRCFAEIDLQAIRHNLEEVKKRIGPGVKVLAVVKADAYGHGAVEVSRFLEQEADYFATASLEEAVELRQSGLKAPVLILGYTSPAQYEEALQADVTITIYSLERAKVLAEAAERIGKKAKVHIALDTGMTRIGFKPDEEAADAIAEIASYPWIELEGMFTHFSCADEKDKSYCSGQMEKYDKMVRLLEERGVEIPLKHMCNSAAIMEFDHHRFNMVRSGIVTYGMYPSEEVTKETLDLHPALEWKAHIIHLQEVPEGVGVSYGATYITPKPMRIATISAGYADGYPRALSSVGKVLIHGKYAPILGRICMDQFMVDVSEIPDVQMEDVVTLIGAEGENRISVEEVAEKADSFNYEQICRISRRVLRRYRF